MHKYSIVAVSIVFAAFCSSVSAQGLLGGLGLGGSGSGVGDVVGTVGGIVEGVTGGSVGLPGVAEVTVGPGGLSDTQVNILGGGGQSVGTGIPGLLGNSPVNLAINLPSGLPGLPGELPIIPGLINPPAGGNGNNGTNGSNGTNGNGNGNINLTFLMANSGTTAVNNGNGGSTGINAATSRLRTLLKILEDRDWLRMVAGNALCLPTFGTANLNGWLSKAEMVQLQGVVNYYKRDIVTLQKMLANCRGNRTQMGRNDVKRVIGLDIKNGKPVLFML